MKNTFLIEHGIKYRHQFIEKCRSLQPRTMVDLAKKTGQSKTNLYKLFEYFELSKEERSSLLDAYVKGVIDDAELHEMAPRELARGGSFKPFEFMGVQFYIHVATGAPFNVLKLKRNKLEFVSERKDKHGDVFYFHDVHGDRKTVLKTVFMYCFHHGLDSVPSGLRVELDEYDAKWYDKRHLVAVTRSKDVKDAHYNAIERATDMMADGNHNEAMKYIKDYMKAYLDTERKKSKKSII